ncbi:hypothetical protein GCM10023238_37080 [Streptomyces heliomycini]
MLLGHGCWRHTRAWSFGFPSAVADFPWLRPNRGSEGRSHRRLRVGERHRRQGPEAGEGPDVTGLCGLLPALAVELRIRYHARARYKNRSLEKSQVKALVSRE